MKIIEVGPGATVGLESHSTYKWLHATYRARKWFLSFSDEQVKGYHQIPEGASRIELPDSLNGGPLQLILADGTVRGIVRTRKTKPPKHNPYLQYNAFQLTHNREYIGPGLRYKCTVPEGAEFGKLVEKDGSVGTNFFVNLPRHAKEAKYFGIPKETTSITVDDPYSLEVRVRLLHDAVMIGEAIVRGINSKYGGIL